MNHPSIDLNTLLRKRQSARHFSSSAVDRTIIEEIITEASWAPSAGNRQPWRVVALSPAKAGQIIGQYEALSWETIYPVLCSVVKQDPRFLGREVKGKELMCATLDLVERELFVKGNPWLIIVYGLKPSLRTFFSSAYVAVKMVLHRLRTLDSAIQKLKLMRYMLRSTATVVRVDQKTTDSSLSNYLYTLHLAATDRGLASCIQFSWALVERELKSVLSLDKRAMILGGLVVGKPYAHDDDNMQRRLRQRKPVPVIWG